MLGQVQGQSQTTILCHICHQPIVLINVHDKIGIDYVGCPNGHLMHRECLKHWMVKNKECPMCHTPFEAQIIAIFDEYIEQLKRDEELKADQAKKLKEEAEKAKAEAAKNPELEEIIARCHRLQDEQNYTAAMNLFWDVLDLKVPNQKDPYHQKILLELAKLYIQMGKPLLAVTQLMKLVKIEYEYPLAFYYMGKAYDKVDQPDKALWAYERAIVTLEKLTKKQPEYQSYLNEVNVRLKKVIC